MLKLAPHHVLKLGDLSNENIYHLIRDAVALKRNPDEFSKYLAGRSLVLLFEKTSTRTNISYQAAIRQLGGYPMVLDWRSSNFAISPVKYEAAYLSRNCDCIMARVKHHETLLEIAAGSRVPVINGCDDLYHPSQALADYLTMYEIHGSFNFSLCYVGVRNNVANSLIEGALALGVRLTLVTPIIQAADAALGAAVARSNGLVTFTDDLEAAVADVDFVYTDTWVDMEYFTDPAYADLKQERLDKMLPYQINEQLLRGSRAKVMHDMPVHPGYEISEELIESERSVIYQQADNRLHAQKALLLNLLTSSTSLRPYHLLKD